MPAGFQTFDDSGAVDLDTSTRVATVINVVTTGKSNGSVTNAAFSKGEPFWSAIPKGGSWTVFAPKITVSGNTLSWTFNNSGASYNTDHDIVYGIY
jgi:hypothetical protein